MVTNKKTKKKNKSSKSNLRKQTQKDMKATRKEDSVKLRNIALNLVKSVKVDLDIINKTIEKLQEQINILETKKIKSIGALSILDILLKENK